MGTLSLTDPVNATTADATLIAANNAAVKAVVNGGIDNTNVDPAAAVALSKLASSGTIGSSSVTISASIINSLGYYCLAPDRSIGYSTGAGGAVVQATNKSTGVTLNTPSGVITMNAASLASVASVTFQLANTVLAGSAYQLLFAQVIGGQAVGGTYRVDTSTLSGTGYITLTNISGGALAEAVQIGYAIINIANS